MQIPYPRHSLGTTRSDTSPCIAFLALRPVVQSQRGCLFNVVGAQMHDQPALDPRLSYEVPGGLDSVAQGEGGEGKRADERKQSCRLQPRESLGHDSPRWESVSGCTGRRGSVTWFIAGICRLPARADPIIPDRGTAFDTPGWSFVEIPRSPFHRNEPVGCVLARTLEEHLLRMG